MIAKRTFWFWIALWVVVINVAGGIYASLTDEPFHAFAHGAVAFGFGLWASYLRQAPRQKKIEADKVELLEEDLSDLQRQLIETQERLDFADKLLKKRPASSDLPVNRSSEPQ